VNDNVKEDFNKSSVHQELGAYLGESSKDDEVSDQAIIKVCFIFFKTWQQIYL